MRIANCSSFKELPTLADFGAGASNALVYVPQGIGYAIVAGVSPIYGLYTGFLPPIVGAFTTGSVTMQVIATNELAIPIGRIAQGMGSAFTVEKLFTLTLLVGVFALLAGLLGLGRIVRFISASVMTGFVLGIMAMLILGQLVNLTGFAGPISGNDLQKMLQVLTRPMDIDLPTLGTGAVTIAATALLLWTRYRRFAYLIALFGVSVAVHALGAPSVVLAGAKHEIDSGFPLLVLPDLNAIPELLLPALTLTIVGLSFGAGVAQAYPARDGNVGSPSRDFFGQGVANVVGAFFQCMPASGSMSRTAYLVETGARTRWANVFTGLTTLVIVLTFVDLAERVPLAVVAGLLMVLGYTAIDLGRLKLVWQINSAERLTMLFTAILTIVLSPPIAILAGIFLSFASFIRTSASSIDVIYLVRGADGRFSEQPVPDRFPSDAPTVLRVHGYLFFADVQTVANRLEPLLQANSAALILSLRGYASVGSTGLIFLEQFARRMAAAGNRFFLADVSEEIQRELERTGVVKSIGASNVFTSQPDPNESIALALDACGRNGRGHRG